MEDNLDLRAIYLEGISDLIEHIRPRLFGVGIDLNRDRVLVAVGGCERESIAFPLATFSARVAGQACDGRREPGCRDRGRHSCLSSPSRRPRANFFMPVAR